MRVNSLTTRFLLALLLSTALPFLLFGVYVRGEMRGREEQQVAGVYLPRWAADAARKIATNLKYASDIGWILVKNAEGYLADPDKKRGIAEFEELVRSLYGEVNQADMVILAGADGRVLSATHNREQDAERKDELESLRPKTVAELAWFKEVSNAEPMVWVDRHLSEFLHRNPQRSSDDPRDYSLGLAFSVQTPEGKHGALYVLLGWQHVEKVLAESAQFLQDKAGFADARAFLCDSRGVVLAHSVRGEYGKTLQPESLRAGVLSGNEGFEIFSLSPDVEHGVGFAGVTLAGGFDWRVGLHAPTAELFEASREFGHWLMIIVPLIALLLVGLGVLSSRAILRPVRRLSEATRSVAQGDLDARVKVRGHGELADLGHAFNTMSEELLEGRERLRDAERQAAWAEMARQIAHEIKNPLTPMRMSAQMWLRARREEDPRQEQLAERLARNVLQQTDALDRIASDFQQFAGSPASDIRIHRADDLLRGVEELVASMAEATAVQLSFSMDAPSATVAVDAQEVRRVFLNLIHNAIQACADGGTVRVRSSVEGALVAFRVEDDGPGIPEDARTRLFEPYFTTKTAGTGLGLAICRRIIEVHGGEIELESSAPRQTVFLFTLPRSEEAPGQEQQRGERG